MAEYMTFIRGIVLVSLQMHYKGVKFLFSNLSHLDTSTILKPHMDALPLVRRDWVDMAIVSLRNLQPLCRHPVEMEYHRLLLEMSTALYRDSFLGNFLLSFLYVLISPRPSSPAP